MASRSGAVRRSAKARYGMAKLSCAKAWQSIERAWNSIAMAGTGPGRQRDGAAERGDELKWHRSVQPRSAMEMRRQSSDLSGYGKDLRRYEPPWISAERYWRRKGREALGDAAARKSGEMIRAAMESHSSDTARSCYEVRWN